VSVQCTSVRLLLNLVEVTFSRRADLRVAEAYRGLLNHILDAFTAKLGALHRRLPQLLAHGAPHIIPIAYLAEATQTMCGGLWGGSVFYRGSGTAPDSWIMAQQ
jgi:hypothetical protein